ncbi:DUF6049 family protein [Bifidobacterium sp. ESL0732]|uniref:DUF6049 family protein n=1 Tax=Bifidobacterium sp. ESL0732 TaxID=2983222 RepID=UPI0023F648D2|nr:DUF6049 family protein [Bifidobacterium sp. ESL0732]WEV64079.1 DUF6049 family protein [Bifidobacterium sp. ESL0732]
MKHSHSCVSDNNTHKKQSPISTRISAIVSSVIVLLCSSALIFSPNAAFAVNPAEATPPSSGTSGSDGSSTSQTPSPSTPNGNANTNPAQPSPTQPDSSQQNGSSANQSPSQQTTSPRSSNSWPSKRSVQNGTDNTDQDDPSPSGQDTANAENEATVTVAASTPVVTSNSGYHLSVAIKNLSNNALPAGTLSVAVNDYYTFVSLTDLQQWAQGNSRIQVPNQIGQVNVPPIAKGEKTSVTIDANPDQESLKNMLSWGPKPVRIDYSFVRDSNDDSNTSSKSQSPYLNVTHTFLTRSTDGLQTANTPPMDITMAMPLTSDSWQVDGQKLTQFMTAGEGDTAKILSTHKLSQTVEQLVNKHPGLQVITDPTLAQSLPVPPKTSGIMQPGNFDITTYSAVNDGSAYEKAGIADSTWNAETGLKEYRDALGDANANAPAYAWPGRGQWTMSSLTTARQQGYTTVIASDATGAGDSNTNSTIRTGKYIIHTSAGDVTVLTAQNELSRLAQGKPTDKTVDGESSSAGRLARFMAQSAFYQMESPYATRNLLVCFDTATTGSENSAQDADTLMQTAEQAPWLKLRNMGDLGQADAYLSGEKAADMVPDSSDIHASTLQNIRQTLAALTASKNDIDRFSNSILDESSSNSSDSGTSGKSETSGTTGDSNNSGASKTQGGKNGSSGTKSGTAAGSGSGSTSDSNSGTGSSSNGTASQPGDSSKTGGSNNSNSAKTATPSPSNANGSNGTNDNSNNANGKANGGKTDTGDAQALARQDADTTAKRSKNGCDWIAAISTMQNSIALHALSDSDTTAKRMSASAQNLASQLMDGIKITPSESITVLSESAKMPVTVSNNHPYPVTVKISSLSDSMEIVTTRFATLSIPARSEAQTTFNVRVSTSGTATAHLTLTDRRGDVFSAPQSTRITSTLRLSDMSGIIFIAVALVLGVIGLWRQFNRKKDPDE